ncbi:MAG: hypothetical protein Q8J78_12510 [Moraxellaceae bacterium]|nr:hypothetical protein [Moraxellaceae bacterium]
MSYIIAFVRFPESGMDYPVACYRTDVRPSESVLVRLSNSRLKVATVESISYLNWDCKSRIECKSSEAIEDEYGILIPSIPITVGLATMEAIVSHLSRLGWIPLKPYSKQYKIALTNSNKTQTANIFFRKNGVDLQILPERDASIPRSFSRISVSLSEGRTVRHFLSQTKFNLYEGIDRFAKCFLSNEEDYDRFFKSVGSSDRAANVVKNRIFCANPEEEMGLRSALSGCEDSEGRIYLCDGVYI